MKKMKKLAINQSNKKYYSEEYIKGWEDGVKAQYEATKDAVQVVRCKDCRYYECSGLPCPLDVCESLGDDGFCSCGERKGGDTE